MVGPDTFSASSSHNQFTSEARWTDKAQNRTFNRSHNYLEIDTDK